MNQREKGAFVVLAALVMAVLFAIIAIAIDSAKILTTQSEKVSTADSIALAALDAYFNKEPPGPPPIPAPFDRHNFKWNEALNKAYDYGNRNRLTFVGGNQISSISSINTASSGAEVNLGRWWLYRPSSCLASPPADLDCPCNKMSLSSNPLQKPCFQQCSSSVPSTGCNNPDGTIGPDLYANAIQVKLSTDAAGGVISSFANLLGVNSANVSGTSYSTANGSVAYSLPQVGVMLFDLSRSTTFDNYLPYERWATTKREYSFQLSSDPGGCGAGTANPCLLPGAGTCLMPNPANYRTEYLSYAAPVRGEYRCFKTQDNGVDKFHLVATASATLPEPYSTLRRAANLYLTQFQTSGRAGDRLAMMGFDNNDFPERHLPNTPALPFIGSNDAYLNTMILNTSTNLEAAKIGFFPKPNSKSNLGQALRLAANKILASYNPSKIDPYILLFTDGFSMCGTTGCANLTLPNELPATQSANMNLQILSLDEALALVGESILEPNRIKVHIVTGTTSNSVPVGGSAISSHTALLKYWGGARCMSDMETRKVRYLNVIGHLSTPVGLNDQLNEFRNLGQAPGNRYTQPMLYLYSLAASTLGQWVPLRRECPTLTKAAADVLCSSGPPMSLSNLPTTANRVSRTRSAAWRVPPATNQIDKDGRLMCEPQDGTNSQMPGLIKTLSNTVGQSRSITLVMPD